MGGKKEYMNYIKKKLKKYKVDAPDQIPNKKKHKFFKEVDKGWESKPEKKEKKKKEGDTQDKDMWVKDVQEEVKEKQEGEKPAKPVVKIEQVRQAVLQILSYKPPEGLFKEPGTQIAKQLLNDSKSPAQAMQRLNFYINRAGSNLSDADMKRLNAAKNIISEAVAKNKEAVTKIAPKRPPKEWWDNMSRQVKRNNPEYSAEVVDKVVGNIWYNKMSPSKKKDVTKISEP